MSHRFDNYGRILVAFVAVLVLTCSWAAQAQNSAQGNIVVNGKKIEFRHAYGVTQTSLTNGKPETILVITDQPLSEKVVTDRKQRNDATISRGVNMLEIETERRPLDIVQVSISVGPLRSNTSTRRYKLELEGGGDKRLKGRLSMEEPWETFGNRYHIDVRFDTSVVPGK